MTIDYLLFDSRLISRFFFISSVIQLCLSFTKFTVEQAMKVQMKTSKLGGCGWSTPRPGFFTPGKETQYPRYRSLVGPQGRSGRVRKIFHTHIRHRTVQPVASRYTDWAVPAHRSLTLILLTWTIWRAPTNASKWRMGFNSAFKGLSKLNKIFWLQQLFKFIK